jgi:uncharacterized protein YheU (UPF0270 family)
MTEVSENQRAIRDKRWDNLIPWKPGQTGNPLGRPRKKTLSELVREVLDREGTDADGNPIRMDETLAENIVKMALVGNEKILIELWERLEGKPKGGTEVNVQINVIQVTERTARNV